MNAGPQSAGSSSVAIACGSDWITCSGPGDPVPVAHDRPECVVHRGRRVAEVLDLLQHRVGQPALERVAGEQQHRQPVGHAPPRPR